MIRNSATHCQCCQGPYSPTGSVCGVYIYTTDYYSCKKEGNPAICNNMDGPQRHETKGIRERQVLYT